MDKNYLYYSNRNKEVLLPCVYPDYRKDMFKYLLKENYLSDYNSEEDLYRVLYNLGILQRLNKLKQIIDNKVIQSGGVAWDDLPTLGNTNHILSSDVLKLEFLKYYTKTLVDNLIQLIWNRILELIPSVDNELSDTSENPVQNKVITQALQNKVSRSEIEDILGNLEGITNLLTQINEVKTSLQEESSRALDAELAISNRVTELEEHGVNPEDNYYTKELIDNLQEHSWVISQNSLDNLLKETGFLTEQN